MDVASYVITFAVAMGGIVLGSVINYFVLRRLFKQQSRSIMDDLIGRLDAMAKSEQADQVREILAVISEWMKSEDAKDIMKEIKRILKAL